jgi:intracellular sulfur oxidation DsrE/DsrF family protein
VLNLVAFLPDERGCANLLRKIRWTRYNRVTCIYKKLVTDLMERGVEVELCGATAKAHGWGNADIIPGIKINTDAMARTTQLVQEGFVKISES